MTTDKRIIHRAQWDGQPLPNSFETFRLYKKAVEADILLLNDSKTLVVVHPNDFKTTREAIERMSPEEFDKLRVKSAKKQDGAAPYFKEYLLGCYDRGIQVCFEVTASTVEKAKQVARQAVEAVKRLREEDAFKVNGQERSEFIENMSLHSYIPEVVVEAKQALKETGVKLQVGFSWLTNSDFARSNSLATTALNYYQEGQNWEKAGLLAAKQLGSDFAFLIDPAKINKEVVDTAHELGLQLYAFILPKDNTKEERNRLLKLGVDKLLY